MVKWNTLDVFFGKRDVDPGAVVLPYRSAWDAFGWYSKQFSVSICLWLDTISIP